MAMQNGVALDYGINAAYTGFNRFGWVVDQKWSSATQTLDRFVHTFNRVGMRLSRDVQGAGAPANLDEFYAYDGLNRLTKFNRGTLSAGTIADTAAVFNQAWTLDAMGNWAQFRVDPDGGANGFQVQTRSHNKANEIDLDNIDTNLPGDSITSTTGTLNWSDPTYDKAGAMTSMPKPGAETTAIKADWDAFGRMVRVKTAAGATIASYKYDGINWRIAKALAGSDTLDYYYGEGWQVLEVRKTPSGSTVRCYEQYVWDNRAPDAPVVRFRNADNSADGSTEQTVYYGQDANYNVTALYDSAGAVLERYTYDPYGAVRIMDANWATRASSLYANELLFAGLRRDPESGLYQARNRYYHPTLGRFISRDPITSLRPTEHYLYGADNPIMMGDPMGTWPEWMEKAGAKLAKGASFVANVVKEFPKAYIDTAKEGRQADSLAGFVHGATRIPVKPPYGHADNFNQGTVVGSTTRNVATSMIPGGKPIQAAIAAANTLMDGGDLGDAALSAAETVVIGAAAEEVVAGGKALVKGFKNLGKEAKLVATEVREAGSVVRSGERSAQEARECLAGSGNCFAAGTLVVTETGVKKIEEILPLERVLSRDEETGEESFQTVVRTFESRTGTLYHLRYRTPEPVGPPEAASAKPDRDLTCSPGHRVWSVTRKEWVQARDLRPGELLSSMEGTVRLESLRREDGAGARFTTYNFEVEKTHTYFVQPADSSESAAVWVHNVGCKEVGSYQHDYTTPDGMRTYVGKGGPDRAVDSAKREFEALEKQYGKGKVQLSESAYEHAGSDVQAFKDEAQKLRDLGGIDNERVINRINSPGEKLLPPQGPKKVP
jgi:RHS repeat-associated protein